MPFSGTFALTRPERVPRADPDPIRAERLSSALHDRFIGRADAMEGPSWRALFLERGSAVLQVGGGPLTLTGPVVLWVPWTAEARLRITAGSVGIHLLAGSTVVANAIGHRPESAELRIVADHRVSHPLPPGSPLAVTLAQAFEGVLRESRDGAAGATSATEAWLRLILIQLWRGEGAPQETGPAGAVSTRIMNRFAALCEAHFRDRWTVAQYAERLGLSADRLTDICRRTRGTTPKHLIDRRVVTEARRLLETSTHSIDQIAGILGFPSASHFNRFFRKFTGTPPGRYRSEMRPKPGQPPNRPESPLHEWP